MRTLVDDFGEVLGCGAHITELRRLTVGSFTASQMVTLEILKQDRENNSPDYLDCHLLPLPSALNHWPELKIAESIAFYLRQGNPVVIPQAPTSGWVRIADKEGRLIGIGEILDDGRVAPRRLI